MKSISFFQDRINKELATFSTQATPYPAELYEPINYTLSLDGKRIRPALLLMTCEMFGGDIAKAIYPAMGVEVFHNFTLVHDDIMDNSPLRRSQPTVHMRWNKNTAILSGDVMLVKAYQYISRCESLYLPEVLKIFSTIAIQVCEGQQLDMNFEVQENVSIADYIYMIELKTAVLLAGSLKIGAVLGKASESDAQHIYEFGKNLGLAFQLQDDILDVYGDQYKFGKQVGGDIISNKKTFLFLKAQELARGETLYKLQQQFTSNEIEAPEKINVVTAIYNLLQIKEAAEQERNEFFEKAMKHLSLVELSSAKKLPLQGFAENLLIREK